MAQNKTVSGKVTDSKDGSPVAGASVTVKGTKMGTQTNAGGEFTISVPSTATTLVVSSVGFGTKEATIGEGAVNISLATAANDLNEVVVVGYGTARKRDLTGSVGSVKAKDFNQGVISSPDQLLQNKVAGLEVTNTSGQPGAATTVKIRGNSSIRSSNNPLYVVDGVPLDGGIAKPQFGGPFGNSPASNPLLYINPYDIAQIDVLKDASSAAIYGSRGANGVIMISTKKGSSGPARLSVNSDWGIFAGYMKKFEVLDAGQFREGIKKYGLNASLDGKNNVDAMDEITQQKVTQNYSLAMSGGTENGKYRASFLASSIPGFIDKSKLDKYIGSFSGQYKFINNKLSIDFNLIAGNVGEQIAPVSNNAGSTGKIVSSALQWNPTLAFKKTDGTYNFPNNGSGNPLAFTEAYDDKYRLDAFLGNISAGYKLLDNLEYKFLFGINHQTGNRETNIQGWLPGFPGLSGLGQAAILNSKLVSQNFTHTLNYRTDFSKDLAFDATVGYEYYKSQSSGYGIGANTFNTNIFYDVRTDIPYTKMFQNAKNQNPLNSGASPLTEIQSLFARVNFNYNDRLLLTGTIRRDGSNKFGSNNKYGNFPSVGARWVISNEGFMKGSKLFSNLALRASWGLTGNQEFAAGSSLEQFLFSAYNTVNQIVNGNPDLKWETTNTINAGLDFGFLSNRFALSLDYYNKNTKDILFETVAIAPAPSGAQFINLPDARLKNEGFEVGLSGSLVKQKDFDWDLNVNFAYNKNLITDFTDPSTGKDLSIKTGFIDGQGVSNTLGQLITNNQPVNVFNLKPFNGYDKDGLQQIGADPVIYGDPNPHVLAGLSTSLRYKKLTLSIGTGGGFGYKIYNNTATSVTNIAGITNGRNIDVAAFESAEKPGSGVGASQRFLEDGDYWKIRNATFRYNVGKIGNNLIKDCSVFVSGTNLLVFTKFTGFDPEVNIDKSNGAYPSRSIEYIPYPTPRTISAGVTFHL
jgi:iron complex outermembrane receptor protein